MVDGWDPYESAPKTDGSAGTIALDSVNVALLREHHEMVSETFRRILATTNLPPITLRDLRHVQATLTHGAGGDLHTIKETLRHSTITLTSDTYTSLLSEVDEAARRSRRRSGATCP